MTSSSRRLAAPGVADAPQVLTAPGSVLDPAVLALLEQAEQAGYERGFADGAAAAADAAAAAAERVRIAVAQAEAGLRLLAAEADIELAARIAAAVLDREPADDGAALLARARAALADLDDPHVRVEVNPRDLEPLTPIASGTAGATTVEVVTDPHLPAGEARLVGRFGRADLTRAGALTAVLAHLAADGSAA